MRRSRSFMSSVLLAWTLTRRLATCCEARLFLSSWWRKYKNVLKVISWSRTTHVALNKLHPTALLLLLKLHGVERHLQSVFSWLEVRVQFFWELKRIFKGEPWFWNAFEVLITFCSSMCCASLLSIGHLFPPVQSMTTNWGNLRILPVVLTHQFFSNSWRRSRAGSSADRTCN